MFNLFIDTSTDFLTLILEEDNNVLGTVHVNNARRHTEQTIEQIKVLLQTHNLKLKDINNFYITAGPGSYTGIRVPFTIIKAIAVINPKVGVYTINTLLFQAGLDNVVSALDAKGNKWYFAVINDNKEIIPTQVIDRETCLEISKQFPDYEFRFNLQDLDFVKNFQILKPYFNKITDIYTLEPLYIKKAIG